MKGRWVIRLKLWIKFKKESWDSRVTQQNNVHPIHGQELKRAKLNSDLRDYSDTSQSLASVSLCIRKGVDSIAFRLYNGVACVVFRENVVSWLYMPQRTCVIAFFLPDW